MPHSTAKSKQCMMSSSSSFLICTALSTIFWALSSLFSVVTTSFSKSLVTFSCFFLAAETFVHNPVLDGLVAVESVAFAVFAFLEGLVPVDCVAALLDLFLLA